MLWATPGPVSEISITVLIGALILVAESASIGIAALAAFLSLLYRLQGPTRELLQSKIALDGLPAPSTTSMISCARPRRPFSVRATCPRPRSRTAVEFRNVSFRYAAGSAAGAAGRLFQHSRGQDHRDRRRIGCGQVDHHGAALSLHGSRLPARSSPTACRFLHSTSTVGASGCR